MRPLFLVPACVLILGLAAYLSGTPAVQPAKVRLRLVGDVIKLDAARTLRVEAEGVGRHPFARLQLVHNGKVVQQARAGKKDGGYAARLVRAVRVSEPAWFAVRIDS